MLMFRSERLDLERPALREAMAGAGAVLRGAVDAPLGVDDPLPTDAAARVVTAWALVHGFAMLQIDGRLDAIVHNLQDGNDAMALLDVILNAGGVFGTTSITSGGFMTWGDPGPGKWVTIYAHAGHVFSEIAGLRNDTGRYDTGSNAAESGPRWRLGPRPKTGFVVRHPPGL